MKKCLPYDCVLCAGSVDSVNFLYANDASDAKDANVKVQTETQIELLERTELNRWI